MQRALRSLAVVVCMGSAACAGRGGHSEHPRGGLPQRMLLAASDVPTLFMGPEHDAPVIGYTSPDLEVEVLGPSDQGRVPVRTKGPLRVEAYVPDSLLVLLVQRRGRVRGTPVYVGPDDPVYVLGRGEDDGRLRVAVMPHVGGQRLGPFEGTYPAEGLAASPAPPKAEPPPPGITYQLPSGKVVALYDEPRGQVATLVPAQAFGLPVTVVSTEQNWFAVRVGEGPYLVGYTNEPLTLIGSPAVVERKPHESQTSSDPSAASPEVPERLRNEPGELRQVAAGTQITFNERVIGTFSAPGFVRVLAEYPEGWLDVFAAADDRLAIRGLMPRSGLREPVSDGASLAPFTPPEDATQ